jgi:hypothetical protein
MRKLRGWRFYYERIQKLAHGLQMPTTYSFFNYCVQNGFVIIPYNCDYKDEAVKLQQHKEATMLCEEGMTITEERSAFSIPHCTK